MKKLIAAALLAGALAPQAGANLIVNGSFEDPVIANGTYAIYTTIPGWYSTSGAGIEIQRSVAGSPYDAAQHIELDSDNNSNAIQNVPTTAGAAYSLSFAYSPRPHIVLDSNPIEVWWEGSLLDTLSRSGVGLTDTDWRTYSYNVIGALDGVSQLEFRAVGDSDSLGGYIDKVSVPDTASTLGLLALGLPLVAFLRRSAK